MESRQKTGPAPARLSAADTAIRVLMLPPLAAEDTCRFACEYWLGIEGKRERLLTAWGRLDRKVAEIAGWRELPDEARDNHPVTAAFADISARLEALTEDSQIGFEAMMAATPTSWPAAIKSLEVAQRLICRGEFEEAVTVIERVVKLMRSGAQS